MSHLRNLIIGAMLDALDDNMLAKHHNDIEKMADDALAAVAPAIRRAALEEAALIADEESAYHYKAIPVENLTSDDPAACPAQQRMQVADTIAAAIRALDTKEAGV